MPDIRGQDPAGKPRDVAVDAAGRLITRARLYGVTEYGDDQRVRVSRDGAVLSGPRIFATPWTIVPGIGAGVAYADKDAFGTLFLFDPVPKSGIIMTALMTDIDSEDINVDLFLFNAEITTGTDNSAFNQNAFELTAYEGIVTLATRKNASTMYGNNDNLHKAYVAPEGKLWVQAVARGAIDIAAGNILLYKVALRIVAGA